MLVSLLRIFRQSIDGMIIIITCLQRSCSFILTGKLVKLRINRGFCWFFFLEINYARLQARLKWMDNDKSAPHFSCIFSSQLNRNICTNIVQTNELDKTSIKLKPEFTKFYLTLRFASTAKRYGVIVLIQSILEKKITKLKTSIAFRNHLFHYFQVHFALKLDFWNQQNGKPRCSLNAIRLPLTRQNLSKI